MPTGLDKDKNLKPLPSAVTDSFGSQAASSGGDTVPSNQPRKSAAIWQQTLITTLKIYLYIPLAILALELTFNQAGIGQGEIVKPDAQLGCRHIPDKFVTWRLEGYSRGKFNSQGMRDVEHNLTKAAGVTRIAFLGDSYTEGLQVPIENIFANAVPKLLNGTKKTFESLNFGCSSYSTGQELLQYEGEARPYKPDVVVLLYTPGDTLENSVSPAKRATAEARPYFYLDAANQLKEDDGLLLYNHEKLKPRRLREFLRAHSTIFGAYNQINLSLSMADKVYFRTTRLISQIAAKLTNIGKRQTSKSDAVALPDGLKPPMMSEPDQVAISAALIKRLNDDVTADGGRLVVMAFPDIGGGDPTYIATRLRLSQLAAEQGFGYLDLSTPFKKDQNPNQLFVQVHFSKLGHDLTARQLSAYLASAILKKD